jgi:HTH-type transcriptional regulator, sugar sensing transcriptional regulator
VTEPITNRELLDVLTDIGLSENQARVYIASRVLGPAKATEISRAAGVKRTTVYPVIESLERLGLMHLRMRGFKRHYAAENPDRLDALVKVRHDRFRKSLAQLDALGAPYDKQTTITHCSTLESIKAMYDRNIADIQPGQDYMVFSSGQELMRLDAEWFEDFFVRRGRLDIRIRVLIRDSKIGQRYISEGNRLWKTETKLFPNTIDFTANLVITPQRVLIHHLIAPTWVIVIEAPQIIRMHQVMFESFWNSLETPAK